MAIKSYKEMSSINVKKHLKQRDKMDYLPWVKCKELLHEHGAEVVYFEPCVNKDGSSLFMSDLTFTDSKGNTNRCYEVRVKIVIDDLEFEYQTPLMNGANPVKDNSMSQQRVWNAQTRAFVKGVAVRTGLGFSLWLNEDDDDLEEDNLYYHNMMKIKERMEILISSKLDRGLSLDDIYKHLNISKDQFDVYMKHYSILDKMEKALIKL